MPYAAGEYRVQVRGHNPNGEIWDNTWCFIDPTGVQDPQEAVDILHAFYEDIHGFASWITASSGSDSASIKNLATGLVSEAVWGATVGAAATAPLPKQLSLRISLRSAFKNGGPFISGFTVSAIAATGGAVHASLIGDFITALETMTAALTAAGWQLGLDQPTAVLASQVTGGRIGNRWDVIRKRANDIGEVYSTFSVA